MFFAQDPMVVLGGGAVSYARGTPVLARAFLWARYPYTRHDGWSTVNGAYPKLLDRSEVADSLHVLRPVIRLQARGASERETSFLTTYWSESTKSRDGFSRPALRHESLSSVFLVALYLPP